MNGFFYVEEPKDAPTSIATPIVEKVIKTILPGVEELNTMDVPQLMKIKKTIGCYQDIVNYKLRSKLQR